MRRHYLDNIKWITVLLVFIFHVLYMIHANTVKGGPGPYFTRQNWDVYQYAVYPWFMTLLFVVSGISTRTNLERHTYKEFTKSRTIKLLVPSTLGLVTFQFLQGIVYVKISGVLENAEDFMPSWLPLEFKPLVYVIIILVFSIGVLWYIQMLWIFSMVLVLIRLVEKDRFWKICKKTPIWAFPLFAVLLWGGAQIPNVPLLTMCKFGAYGVAFLLGYFVFSHEENTDKVVKLIPGTIPISIALGIAYILLCFDKRVAASETFTSTMAMAYAWFSILAIFGIMKRWLNFTNRFLSFMTRKSWGIYMFHYLGISLAAYLLYNFTQVPPVLIWLIIIVAGYVIAFGLYEAISRIPILRFTVLGITKSKKKKPEAGILVLKEDPSELEFEKEFVEEFEEEPEDVENSDSMISPEGQENTETTESPETIESAETAETKEI